MKINELKYYKPLDITQISGSSWNTAEKVLGLDENDEVVMAEPEESVTPEYVDSAITSALTEYYTKEETDELIEGIDVTDQLADYAKTTAVTEAIETAIASETARTESTYLKEHQDISGKLDKSAFEAYSGATETLINGKASEQYVDDEIAASMALETARTENTYLKEHQSLSDYYTKSQVDTKVGAAEQYADAVVLSAIQEETARTENTYLKEHQSLEDYYTKAQVDAEITGATDGLASEQYVDDAIAAAEPDLSDYYTKAEVEAKGYLTGITTSDPNVVISGNNINLAERLAHYKENLLENMAVVDANGGVVNVYSGTTGTSGSEYTFYYSDVLSNSLDMSATPILLRIDVSETSTPYYIYSSFAGDGGYENLFAVSLNDNTGVTGIPDGGNCRIGMVTDGNSNIATFLESGFTYSEADYYVTESEATSAVSSVTSAIEETNTRFADYYTKADIDNSGYATQDDINTSLEGYATEGYVDDAIAGIPIPSVPVDVSELNNDAGYVTQTEIDDAVSGKADSTAVTQEIQSAIASETARTESTYLKEHQSLADYAKTTAVTEAIETAIASETARTESTYLKEHQDISGKLDKTDFNTYTGATQTAINAKQDTLVSGTNIKTINNESILGSGNITIQGGEGGGETVIELTQDEYDALTEYAEDTTYIITDASTVDLNDFALQTDLETVSGSVNTLASSVSSKADAASVSANSGYRRFPYWNSQGIITGYYETAYQSSQNINGSNYIFYRNSSSTLPAQYAPTTVGTAGQPLLSNGSGAPVWGSYKFVFISQTDYDALSSKDSTTIYFITGD